MRKPVAAPKMYPVDALPRDRLVEALLATPGPLVDGKYLHWDKLRRLNPPGDLSHEEWWYGLKFRRQQLFQEIPLVDEQGQLFRFASVSPIPQQLHEIDQRGGGVIQMPEQVTNPETRDQYFVASLMQEAITSSQLEGAATTRKVAKEMLRTGRKPRDRSERMIFNNYVTMRRIVELKDRPLTKELLLELHEVITEETLDNADEAGRFRKENEPVRVYDVEENEILHIPPPADQLEWRIEAMCSFANGETPNSFVHPAIRSMILHFWLAFDHPFVDGNGRVARSLFYWSMLRHKYWPFEFLSISEVLLRAPARYSRAFLYTESDQNDLTYFILFHIDVIQKALDELHHYVSKKSAEIRAVDGLLRSAGQLNHRQRALINHAVRHPNAIYTIESHRASHDVVYQTSRSDLLGLKDMGYLEGQKAGKTWYFRPAKHLQERLASKG